MILNKTKNTVIADIFSAKRGFGKIRGLVNKEKPEAIILTTRFGIHTFLVKFPIDILILDKNKKVISLRKNLKPNRIFLWNPLYNIVVELPSGALEKSKTQVGDILKYNL